jgi:hypothetical protein
MNTLDREVRAANSKATAPVGGSARNALLIVLVSSVFLVAAQSGLNTICHISQISIHILVEVCRMSLAALQIFGR